ncbi:hypothetical protein [Mariniradius saccharolyticus]|nr:hypothetical protein [Mariniradius saccharolyticus]
MKNNEYWKQVIKQTAVLSPVDRVAEVLFGLIMVLTFTGAISASTDSEEDVRQLLWAALGCNVAWGLVDAIMYLMNLAVERGHAISVIRKISKSENQKVMGDILRAELPPGIAGLMKPEELSKLGERFKEIPEPNGRNLITKYDLFVGLQIFLLVFLCTFPVALPFAWIDELKLAMRISNGIALIMLGVGGYLLAKYANFRPWLTALIYSLIGVLLVALTMALGG